MTTIFDLLNLRDEILEIESTLKNCSDITELENTIEFLIDQLAEYQKLIDQHKLMLSTGEKIVNDLNLDTKSKIDSLVDTLFNNENYRLKYHENNLFSTLSLNESIDQLISATITKYVDWRYPALQINPRAKKWIDLMIAGDPLYLTNHENLNHVHELIAEYPQLYQSRLRLYQIDNRDFSGLPQEQFNFVLCWDNFNQLSIEKIEQYIKQVFHLLRPGGVFMFSFNNCDISSIAKIAENGDVSYSTGDNLKQLCLGLGYEVIHFKDVPSGNGWYTHISWAEVRKPGTLSTVKAHQALASIGTK